MKIKPSQNKIYFVDTNILMYASGTHHPLKKLCIELLLRSARGELEMRTSVEVIQEILHRYSLIGQLQAGINLASEVFRVFNPVLPVIPADIHSAMDIMKKYPVIHSRDAVHAAVALNNGMRHIVSKDHHFDLIKEVVRVDPSDFA